MTDEARTSIPTEVGAEVTADDLARLSTQATREAAGYALTIDFGDDEVTIRRDRATQAVSSDSPAGSYVRVGDRIRVRVPGGAWVDGDVSSSDPQVVDLTEMAIADIGESAPDADPEARLTVTGSTERLGRTVSVLRMDWRKDDTHGSLEQFVLPDGGVLETVSRSAVGEAAAALRMTMTAWDEPQQITLPE